MSEQTLPNKIGNVVGEAKRRLLDRVKQGSDLDDSIALFVGEVRLGLERVSREQPNRNEAQAA